MLDGIASLEKDFYLQQQKDDRRWGRAVNFAALLHIAVFAGALYLPLLFDKKPLLDDVMTIDLVSLPEPVESMAPEASPVAEQKPEVETDPTAPPPEPENTIPVEPVVSVAEPEPPAIVEARPISVRPLKRKQRQAKDTRLVEEIQREQRAKEIKRQQQQANELKRQQQAKEAARQKAIADARKAEQRAQDAARRARAELASVIREQQTFHASGSGRGSSKSSGNKQVNSIVEKQYYTDLSRRVQQLWVLPEMRQWASSLVTIVEFTVLRDGRLINITVAKSSGDSVFDRFARESVRKAAPMPPFPTMLRKDRLDLGLRLSPGGIQH